MRIPGMRENHLCFSNEAGGREGAVFTRLLAVDLDGDTYDMSEEDFEQCPVFEKPGAVYGMLRQFVSNEVS